MQECALTMSIPHESISNLEPLSVEVDLYWHCTRPPIGLNL
jgi:hypothetical protein